MSRLVIGVLSLLVVSCSSDIPRPQVDQGTTDTGADLKNDISVDAEADVRVDVVEDVATDAISDANGEKDTADATADATTDADAGPRPSDCAFLPYQPIICDGYEGVPVGNRQGNVGQIEGDAAGGRFFMRAVRTGADEGLSFDVFSHVLNPADQGSSIHVRWFQRQPPLFTTVDPGRFATLSIRRSPSHFVEFRPSSPDETRFFSGGLPAEEVFSLTGDAFPSDVWACVEISLTYGAGDATIEGRLNGAPLFSGSNYTHSGGFDRIDLGLVSFDAMTPEIDFDEFIVATGEQLDAAGLTSIGCDLP